MRRIARARDCWKRHAAILAATIGCVACSVSPTTNHEPVPPADRSMLLGWMHCTDNGCGKNFASAYSTFMFLQIDDTHNGAVPAVIVTPGRHWVEAYYSWGAGVITGIGNYRNYGFEIEALPGYTYQIEKAPSGCIVPAKKHWVSRKTLQVIEISPSGERAVRNIPAMEYCTPESRSPGSCKKNDDCSSGICTTFGGTTGYGMCGALRK